ncbi:MAG TPA: VanZ family protein [Gemmatimonadales bacterium]|nr:VanZ family protein [Gemmatimonadales bacterium]
MNRRAALIFAILSAAAILFLTLRPGGTEELSPWSFYLTAGDDALGGLLQNLILYIPFGVFLTLAGVRPYVVCAIGAAMSFCVEFSQQYIPGRDPSVGDVVCNSISTALGVLLVVAASIWLFAPPRRSTWQAIAATVIAILTWWTTAEMVKQVMLPLPYNVLTTPDLDHFGVYKGKIVEVRPSALGGRIDVVATAAPYPPGRTSPLLAIVDQQGRNAIMLSVDGQDLTLRYYMRALSATLEQPDLRFRGAMRDVAPADTFIAGTWHDSTNICLRVNHAQRCGLGYTIGDGWKLIYYPEGRPPWQLGIINAAWLVGCVIFVGFWGARSNHAWLRRLVIATVILGSIVVPLATGLKATPLYEFLSVIAGLACGNWIGRRTIKQMINDQ